MGVVLLLGIGVLPARAPARRLRFSDQTQAANLNHKASGTWGSVWVDNDRAGFPDLLLGRHLSKPFYFRNRGNGTYRRAHYDLVDPPGYDPVNRNLSVDRHNCAWGEATGDGLPDLYCSVGANQGTGAGPKQLLTWASGRPRDIARRYRVRDVNGRGRSVNWLDYDSDGDLDLYLGNWARTNHPSAFFKNQRGRFRRVSVGVADQLRTISSSWSDWDRDGDPDLLVMQFAAPTVAYENRGRRFARVSLPGVTGLPWYSAAWGDYNGDGYTDLHLVSETRSLVMKNVRGRFRAVHGSQVRDGRMSTWFDAENDGDLDLFVVQGAPGTQPRWDAENGADFMIVRRRSRFVRTSRRVLRGRRHGSGDTVATADHDRDGRMDLFVTNGYSEYEQWVGKSLLLKNRTHAFGWIALDLHGGRWNPLGFGARVRVKTAHFVRRREITDGVTFRSQSESGHVHIGIRRAQWARVRIRWSDGDMDCLRVRRNRTVRVRKGRHRCYLPPMDIAEPHVPSSYP